MATYMEGKVIEHTGIVPAEPESVPDSTPPPAQAPEPPTAPSPQEPEAPKPPVQTMYPNWKPSTTLLTVPELNPQKPAKRTTPKVKAVKAPAKARAKKIVLGKHRK